jgi:hypothetical protein
LFYTFNETCLKAQFGRSAAQGVLGKLSWHVTDFEKYSAGADNGDPMVDSAFTFTHTHFSRLFCHRLIWENSDPHFTTALEITVDRNAASFDLLVSDPATLEHLDTEFAEVDELGTFAEAGALSFLHLAVLGSFRH